MILGADTFPKINETQLVVADPEIVMFVRFSQPKNEPSAMDVKPFPNVTLVKLEQP